METKIQLGDITVEVVLKDIQNVHLSVYPPAGRVRIAAPRRMNLDTIRVFAISKLAWIKEQQRKLREQDRETPRDYITQESHYVWGRRYLLHVIEVDASPLIELGHRRLTLRVRPGTPDNKKSAIVEHWYRELVRQAVPPLLAQYEPILGVKLGRFSVRQMKTKWGSCTPGRSTIRLNTELAKKPPECLEYIVVHELAHLLEPTHNTCFFAIMDRVMPQWSFRRKQLNLLPVRHEEWAY